MEGKANRVPSQLCVEITSDNKKIVSGDTLQRCREGNIKIIYKGFVGDISRTITRNKLYFRITIEFCNDDAIRYFFKRKKIVRGLWGEKNTSTTNRGSMMIFPS